ncbi:MAG: PaaX family transcriptional regulator C-terminal domain-containing protein [Mycobacteriales bacterium]
MPETGGRPPLPIPGGRDLIPYMFGFAEAGELPGDVLTQLLVDVGLTAAAARTSIARMRRRGGLAARRVGRRAHYRLAGEVRVAYERLDYCELGPAVPWTGEFHTLLYSVPEHARPFRDRLRNVGRSLGYGQLRPGALISPIDRWAAVSDIIGTPPAAAQLYPGRLTLGEQEARLAAREAWDLDAMSRTYARQRTILAADLADISAPPADGRTALRRLLALGRPVYAAMFTDPSLPAELLPPDWPRAAVLTMLERVEAAYDRPIRQYVETLFELGS